MIVTFAQSDKLRKLSLLAKERDKNGNFCAKQWVKKIIKFVNVIKYLYGAS